jgi:hypothetical protein
VTGEKKMATRRVHFEVVPSGNEWDVTRDGKKVSHHRTKQNAVDKAAAAAKREEGDAELRIKRQDGTIQDERTYGHDPRKTPG